MYFQNLILYILIIFINKMYRKLHYLYTNITKIVLKNFDFYLIKVKI